MFVPGRVSQKVNLAIHFFAYALILLGILGSLYLVVVIYIEQAQLVQISQKVEDLSKTAVLRFVGARKNRLLVIAGFTAFFLATGTITYLLSEWFFKIIRYFNNLSAHATAIIENLSSAVISIDRGGRICYLNPAGEKMFPAKDSNNLTHYKDYFQDYPSIISVVEEELSNLQDVRYRDVEVKKGTLCRINCSHFGNEGDLGIIMLLDDITGIRVLEDRMKQKDRLAGLGTISAGLAHEIKNPLSAIKIHFQLLEEKLETNGQVKQFLKYIDVIKAEIYRLNRVLENILRFARSPVPKVQKTSLPELLTSLLEVVDAETRGIGIQIKKSGFDEDILISGDRDELQHVFFNIVVNAIQAMKGGGILEVNIGIKESYAQVEIADTGPGIPPQYLDRVFDLFFTTKEEGTGYGLAIAQKIVEEHGGFIDVKNRDAGASFTVSLPAIINTQSKAKGRKTKTGVG